MRKALLLLLALVFTASAATAITIESPSLSRYTQDPGISLQVSGADGDVRYSLNGNGNESCDCTDSSISISASQGENTLTVYDVDGDSVDTDTASFFVDTEAPAIDTTQPEGTIFDLSPEIRIEYRDISTVDTARVRVALDGEALAGSADGDGFNTSTETLSEGSHRLSYNIPDEHWRTTSTDDLHNATGSWNFNLPVKPVLTGRRPTGAVGASPEITVTARDPSGIAAAASSITVAGPEEMTLDWNALENRSTSVDHGIAFLHQLENLTDGEYTVTANIEDTNGNMAEKTWTFTVDTTAPTLSFHSHVTGDVVKDGETFAFNVTDLTAVGAVNISIGSVTASAEERGGFYVASVDTTRIDDGTTTMRVTAEDTNGNRVTRRIQITVDNNRPVVEDVELYPSPARGGLAITAQVRDASTSIIGARYRIKRPGADRTLTSGRLEAVQGEYDSLEEQVRAVIDLQQLDLRSGDYTALLRAEDSAGHQYGWFGNRFTVDNSLQPRLELGGRMFRQEIGTTKTFSVQVSNTGEVDELVSPRVETGLKASMSPDTKRIQTGESKQFQLEIFLPGNRSYLGGNTITVHADGLSSDAVMTTEVIGQPLSGERQEIEERFQTLQERVVELNASRQEWAFGGEVERQFQETAALVSEVEQLLAEGRYAQAEQKLEAAEETFAETESSFTGEVTRARLGSLASAALKLLAVLALVGFVYGGYRLIPPEAGYNQERGYTHRPGGKHPLMVELEGHWRRFRARIEQESREEQRERTVRGWSGYGRD